MKPEHRAYYQELAQATLVAIDRQQYDNAARLFRLGMEYGPCLGQSPCPLNDVWIDVWTDMGFYEVFASGDPMSHPYDPVMRYMTPAKAKLESCIRSLQE